MVSMRIGFRIGLHRPELIANEFAPFITHALLFEQNRATRSATNDQSHDRGDKNDGRREQQDEGKIEASFPGWLRYFLCGRRFALLLLKGAREFLFDFGRSRAHIRTTARVTASPP